ncbi:hypothetical protein FACS189473_2650 [Spirochaetia bacterium]|nr:hypothetical protein FACS189473_2650 [Spirochaetia bacterium]
MARVACLPVNSAQAWTPAKATAPTNGRSTFRLAGAPRISTRSVSTGKFSVGVDPGKNHSTE